MAQVTATLAGAGKKLTFEQYLLLPYDGRRTEFVDGEIIEMHNLECSEGKIIIGCSNAGKLALTGLEQSQCCHWWGFLRHFKSPWRRIVRSFAAMQGLLM